MTDVNPSKDEGRDRDKEGQRLVPAEEVSQIIETRINANNAKHDTEMSHLRGQLDTLVNQSKPQKKTYTLPELEKGVADNTITQTEANTIWRKQEREEDHELIVNTINQAVQGEARNTAVQSQIDKYLEVIPDLKSESQARRNVQSEIDTQMLNSGLSKANLGLELNALRTLYGPAETLGSTEQHDRQSDQEIGGGGEGNNPPSGGLFKNATPLQKEYYTEQMNKGNYTKEQVEKELNSKFNKHGKV